MTRQKSFSSKSNTKIDKNSIDIGIALFNKRK